MVNACWLAADIRGGDEDKIIIFKVKIHAPD